MLAPWIEDATSKALLIEWSDAIGLDLVHLGVHADAEEIKDTANAQPLIVAAGLLSARTLDISGKYSYVAGHSVGEITAAAIAGVLTPLDAMKLVRTRGVEMAKAAAIAIAIPYLLFVIWDAAGIALGIFFKGQSGLLTGIMLAKDFPIEELFFLALLCYTTLIVATWFGRAKR